MTLVSSALVNFGRLASLLQVLFYLPLSLDLAGTEAFLALSASLASYYFILSTIRLMTKNTRLAWIGNFLAIFQFVVIPACLLVCFNVYSPPSESYFAHLAKRPSALASAGSSATSAAGRSSLFGLRAGTSKDTTVETRSDTPHDAGLAGIVGAEFDTLLQAVFNWFIWSFFFLARNVPGWWSTFLRFSSPLFSLLEGVASVLVIQAVGSMSRWVIATSLSRPPSPRKRLLSYLPSFGLGGAEGWQLLFLLLSAFTYVSSAVALYLSFEGATRDRPGAAAAVGVSVSSTFWLTAIAFAVRKGNVVETSLMLAYVVFNVTQLSDSLAFTADPLALIRSFKVNTESGSPLPLLPSVVGSTKTLVQVGGRIAGHSIDFISAALAALPKSVIVSLLYRLMVLYAASRILPLLKAGGPPRWLKPDKSDADDYDDYSEDEYDSDEDIREEEKPRRKAEQKSLSEEEPFGAFISIIVSYSRLIMIAVYSHLLLLDQSHQIYWRFLTVGITLTLWAFELLIGKEDADAFTREWKIS
ncbi:hypothetical protein K437DRAFT_240439 [Tilletiaria anomala UBC 951]|uniref:ICE2-domain-containing protein n=1 Tax=Tilletiaria anomala (strain ATCC 24038 / CBS 436.72 / UBC 951) TaxID=1037660 RepID=A0A066VH80_TILAU|nr:uncharacterized protein K437DRAFT_240439 [Tilletiaria anomala UBC 951]KDN37910.1 hypothetical protein K437DRAFT_240439 [Tilletiaria anomala UBC 951]